MSDAQNPVHSPSERVAMQKRPRRNLALLTEGLEIFRNKTAMGMLRYCPEDIACVIDSTHVGQDLFALTGLGQGIPVVEDVAAAQVFNPDYLVIGISTPGGYLPEETRAHIYEAIALKLSVISGLHQGLNTDPNIASLACRHAVDLIDLRQVPEDETFIASGRAAETQALRVLTVGTDCNLGKMTTAMQLEMFMRNQMRIRARFVATGQNGMLIKGRGVCIDRVISDFAAGAVERLILREDENMDILIIEGQGAILSPPFSGVATSLLHGSLPDAMILCHRSGRTLHRNSEIPIPPIAEYIDLYERMLQPLHKQGRVVAVSLNTQGMSDAEAEQEIAAVRAATSLPVSDVVRQGALGCEILADAVLNYANQQLGKGIHPDPTWQRSVAAEDFHNTIIGHRKLSEG